MQEPIEASGTEPKPATPIGERSDGTSTAAKLVEEVVNGVKGAVDGALTWAEKKVDELNAEQYGTPGPYTSPATCVQTSDLDVIASGILPAMPTQEQAGDKNEGQKANAGSKDGPVAPKL